MSRSRTSRVDTIERAADRVAERRDDLLRPARAERPGGTAFGLGQHDRRTSADDTRRRRAAAAGRTRTDAPPFCRSRGRCVAARRRRRGRGDRQPVTPPVTRSGSRPRRPGRRGPARRARRRTRSTSRQPAGRCRLERLADPPGRDELGQDDVGQLALERRCAAGIGAPKAIRAADPSGRAEDAAAPDASSAASQASISVAAAPARGRRGRAPGPGASAGAARGGISPTASTAAGAVSERGPRLVVCGTMDEPAPPDR